MQIFEDKIRFQARDFEYLRSFWEAIKRWEGLEEDCAFDEYAGLLAKGYTERVDRKLSSATLGTKSENTRAQCVRVFGFIWKEGSLQKENGFPGYVRRNKIENDLGYYRPCGAPGTRADYPEPVNKRGGRQENQLARTLRRLEKAGLVEGKRDVVETCTSRPKTTFYRVSRSALGEILTPDEQIRRFTKAFWKQDAELNIYKERTGALLWLLSRNGIDTSDIDTIVKEWKAGRGGQQRIVTYGGPLPSPAKK
jgi:hypothetical protein